MPALWGRGTRWAHRQMGGPHGVQRECVRWRVKDMDFERRESMVREGKGMKDRVTGLPDPTHIPLQAHLVGVKQWHDADLAQGSGAVYLPLVLERKYPNAHWPGTAWRWGAVMPPQDAWLLNDRGAPGLAQARRLNTVQGKVEN